MLKFDLGTFDSRAQDVKLNITYHPRLIISRWNVTLLDELNIDHSSKLLQLNLAILFLLMPSSPKWARRSPLMEICPTSSTALHRRQIPRS